MQINLSKSLVSLLTLVAGVTVCHGASFITDFNSGLPAGSSIYGNAFVDTAGGVTNSGTLKVTTAAGNLQGSYIVEDIAGGVPITNFTLSYKLNLGGLNTGNRIADGMSFCYGTDLPNATWGEEGVGNGLVITFDTWDNAAPDSAPAIEVHYGGATLACVSMAGIRNDTRVLECGPILTNAMGQDVSLDTSNTFVNVQFVLHPDNTLDLYFKDIPVFTGVALTGFTPFGGGRFGWGARTGGANEDAFIDNLTIFANFSPGPVTIVSEPADVAVTESQTASFTVGVDGTPPFSIQWFSNNVAIAGATGSSYTTPPTTLAMNGWLYHAEITNPLSTTPVSSRNALLTVNAGTLLRSVSTHGQTNKVSVVFSKPVNLNGSYTINAGTPDVSSKAYGANHTEVVLMTEPLSADTTYTLTITGVTGEDGSALVPSTIVATFQEGFGPFCANFNDLALPAGSSVNGVAFIGDDGTGNGVVHLTDAANGVFGSYFISNRVGGTQLKTLTAQWRALIGGGAGGGADGLSFNWGGDLTSASSGDAVEGLTSSGLSVTVDTFDNGAAVDPGGTGIQIKWAGNILAFASIPKDNPGTGGTWLRKSQFVDASVQVNGDGSANFTYDGVSINARIPSFNGVTGGGFMFAARTGGANDNHWIDDICINNNVPAGIPISLTLEPVDTTTLELTTATFTAAASGTPPYYFQWYTNGVPVPGGIGPFYTTPPAPAGLEGLQVHVVASNEFSNVTSSNATLHVLLSPRVVSVFTRKDADVHVIFTREVDLTSGSYTLDNTGTFESGRAYGSNHKEVVITYDTPLALGGTYSLIVQDVTGEGTGLDVLPNPTTVSFKVGFGFFCANFDDNLVPAGATIGGTATISGGFLHITDEANSQSGRFIVADQFGGQPLDRLLIKFRLLLGKVAANQRIADGWSLNFASDLGTGNIEEEGSGSGLTVTFDTWDNAGGDTAPAIDLRYKGSVIAVQSMEGIRDGGRATTAAGTAPATPVLTDINGNPVSLDTSNVFVNVMISVDPDGKADVYYKDIQVFHKVQLPNFTPFVGARLGIGGRTGGANESCWIDDLCINGFALGGVVFNQQPADVTINEGRRTSFLVRVDGLPPYSMQWFSNNVAIAGADALVYNTPPLNRSANGAGYSVIFSNFCGFFTSRVAMVTIQNNDNTPPAVLSAMASCIYAQYTNVLVTFSEPLDPASASSAGNYTINNGIAVNAATLQSDGRSVALSVSPPLSKVDCNVLTVNAVKDLSTFNQVAPNSKVVINVKALVLATGPQNVLVFEAEDFDNKASGANPPHDWVFNTLLTGLSGFPAAGGTFSGTGDMEALPNNGIGGNGADFDRFMPRLDYCVNLPVSGTWYVWVRYVGPTGGDNSFHLGIDGAQSSTALRVGNNVNANRYEWNNFNNAGGAARFDAASAGTHIFSCWMREDGVRVDKFLLTSDAGLTFPDISVLGPDSTRENTQPKLRARFDGTNDVVEWDAHGCRLQCTTVLGNPPVWQDVATASPYTVPFQVNIDANQEVPSGGGRTGTGTGTITLSGNTLTINIAFSGLSANLVHTHIHGPAIPGVNTGILYPMDSIATLGVKSGTIAGTVPLVNNPNGSGYTIAQQIEQLRNGLWYVNLHTTTFGGGEIRGQVLHPSQSFYRLVAP